MRFPEASAAGDSSRGADVQRWGKAPTGRQRPGAVIETAGLQLFQMEKPLFRRDVWQAEAGPQPKVERFCEIPAVVLDQVGGNVVFVEKFHRKMQKFVVHGVPCRSQAEKEYGLILTHFRTKSKSFRNIVQEEPNDVTAQKIFLLIYYL